MYTDTQQEVIKKNMKNGKTLVLMDLVQNSALTIIKCFWKKLGLFVVWALNEAFIDGELSST